MDAQQQNVFNTMDEIISSIFDIILARPRMIAVKVSKRLTVTLGREELTQKWLF